MSQSAEKAKRKQVERERERAACVGIQRLVELFRMKREKL